MSEFVQPQKKGDLRGGLNVFERSQEIPFDVKRIYYLFDTAPDVSRGFHAHKSLQQLAICLAGNCDIILDNGHARELVQLNPHSGGLLIGSMVWREMNNFSKDCVLLVLASEEYDEAEYIRNYDEFREQLKIEEK